MQMHISKGFLIVITGGLEESRPKWPIVLPAQTQGTAVLCRKAVQLMRRERRDDLRHTGNHSQRESRHAPVPFDRVPGEHGRAARAHKRRAVLIAFGQQAPVDNEVGAGDVGRLIGCEKNRRVRHVLRGRESL